MPRCDRSEVAYVSPPANTLIAPLDPSPVSPQSSPSHSPQARASGHMHYYPRLGGPIADYPVVSHTIGSTSGPLETHRASCLSASRTNVQPTERADWVGYGFSRSIRTLVAGPSKVSGRNPAGIPKESVCSVIVGTECGPAPVIHRSVSTWFVDFGTCMLLLLHGRSLARVDVPSWVP